MRSALSRALVSALVASSTAESIYDFSVPLPGGKEVSLAEYGAKVHLIVNTASKCGFTGQYQGLQELHTRFGGDLAVLAFPCNQFFAQEPGSDAEIQDFVKTRYGVTFPVFGKVEVNGPAAHPLFAYLKRSTDTKPKAAPWAPKGPGEEYDVQWNFNKFLCVDGVPVKRYDYDVEPVTMVADIEAAIKEARGAVKDET